MLARDQHQHPCPPPPAPTIQWPVDMPPPRPEHSDSIGHEVGIDLDLFVAVMVHELGYSGAPLADQQPYIQAGLTYMLTHDINQHQSEPAYQLAELIAHMTWNVPYF